MEEQIKQLLHAGYLPAWGWNILLFAAALVLGLVLRLLLSLFARNKAVQTGNFSLFRVALRHLGNPMAWFLPLFLVNFLLPVMDIRPVFLKRISRMVEILLIINFSWILLSCLHVAQDYFYHRFDFRKADNLRERKIRTQVQFLRQVLSGLIVLLTIAAVLLTFSAMRKIGAGLLTGVGIGGIIIGFAAQKSLGNLLAGFQIAFTQPVRIDDVVIVEGEYGVIEEINLTYVVVRLWDERRLILPINYFIEKPFQNWTRTSAQLLGTVFLYADYSVPVAPLREELTKLLKNTPLWDGRVNAVHVTNTTEKTVEIRALMSARTSGNAFDLRCYVRENLLRFLNENYPDCLPKARAFVENGLGEMALAEAGEEKN
ncbi:mechanosensitive ion channel domain-containing protein [Paraflavisolibacter sp. H34]|uniref:mechanosensitive ion channel family protein n=1 Tax=Huijunlia imazamoxiresistens TaxID=3127457 RepID=UPI00301983DA